MKRGIRVNATHTLSILSTPARFDHLIKRRVRAMRRAKRGGPRISDQLTNWVEPFRHTLQRFAAGPDEGVTTLGPDENAFGHQ